MNDNILNFNEERQDLIDCYLKGEMSEHECSIFEQGLMDDKELNEQFIYARLIQEVISSRSSKIEKISHWENMSLNSLDNSLLHTLIGNRLWPYRWVASVVLIFSLGILGINLIIDKSNNGNAVKESAPAIKKDLEPQEKIDSDSIIIDSTRYSLDSIIYRK